MADDGSSPRTWETLILSVVLAMTGRFIPTHVGNTRSLVTRLINTAVHPHARGKHAGRQWGVQFVGGSSPRTWETQIGEGDETIAGRFIPTHVGNTEPDFAPFIPSAVHPHARGKHRIELLQTIELNGSSPRTWETLAQDWGKETVWRFIPTHVGNTRAAWPTINPESVHPHARGKHLDTRRNGRSDYGSSPRTWETRFAHSVAGAYNRFIPTHVGNTPPSRSSRRQRSVHPHARGKHDTFRR